jgi:hypothetical protein
MKPSKQCAHSVTADDEWTCRFEAHESDNQQSSTLSSKDRWGDDFNSELMAKQMLLGVS